MCVAHPSRYIFSANVADYSGQIWINGFDEIGQLLIGMTADELDAIRVRLARHARGSLTGRTRMRASSRTYCSGSSARSWSLTAAPSRRPLTCVLQRLSAVLTLQDTNRVRYTVTKAVPVDFAQASNELVDQIHSLQVAA